MHAFILAGGFATRLWPLTEKRAKPLLPLAGKPIISYLVEQIPAEIPVTVSTNKAFEEDFTAWAKEMNRQNLTVIIEHTRSDDEKLGALGATAQWITEQNITDDLLILTGDNYCGFSFTKFLAEYEGVTRIAAFDIQDLEQAKQFGTVVLKEGTLDVREFEEKPKEPKSTLVNTGCSIIPKQHIPLLIEHAKEHPDNIGGIFEAFLQHQLPIECFTFTEPWFDIGSFDAYIECTKALVGERSHAESGARIENAQTHGSIVLGKNSIVQGGKLTNVVVFEDCTIEDCVLEDCIIDNGCHLKNIDLTGKMLREETNLVRE